MLLATCKRSEDVVLKSIESCIIVMCDLLCKMGSKLDLVNFDCIKQKWGNYTICPLLKIKNLNVFENDIKSQISCKYLDTNIVLSTISFTSTIISFSLFNLL